MSDRDTHDEEYMQDAIAAGKAAGTLHEVNPQDAPAPVRRDLASAQPRHPVPDSLADAALSAEDKAFAELQSRGTEAEYAKELSRKMGNDNARILMDALREGQGAEAGTNHIGEVAALRAVQTALHQLAESRNEVPFDDSTPLGIAQEVSDILFGADADNVRRVNEALKANDEAKRGAPGAFTAQEKARAANPDIGPKGHSGGLG